MESSFSQERAAEVYDNNASAAYPSKATALGNEPNSGTNTERLVLERRWIEATGQSVLHALTGKLLAGALAYEEQL